MNKFLVLYMAPAAGLEEWSKTDPEVRKVAEEKMRAEWGAWMAGHTGLIKETAGAGKTKRVTSQGSTDVKNDIMLYSVVEGESPEAVASVFQNHPHFGIPNSWIEVMPIHMLPAGQEL